MVITSTLNIEGKNLIIKGAKGDGSNAELDGQGTTRLVWMMDGSTVEFTGINFRNGYAVSMTSAMCRNAKPSPSLSPSDSQNH